MARFGRYYKIKFLVGYIEQPGMYDSNPIVEDTIQVEYPITLDLSITKNVEGMVNTAQFTLYGLKESTRNLLFKIREDEKKYIGIYVQAGYTDDKTTVFNNVFIGTVRECYSFKPSGATEFRTQLDCWDGGNGMVLGQIAESFDAETPPLTMYQNLVNNLPGVRLGVVSPNVLLNQSIRGKTEMGKTYSLMNDLTENNMYIENQELNLIDRKKDVVQGDVEYIELDDYLLGSPRQTDKSISLEMFFTPELKLAQQVELKSKNLSRLNGKYKIMGITHEGVISGSKSGSLITKVQLFIGDQIFNLVTGQPQ